MNNTTESLEHASVRQHCKAVRMPVIAANFVSLAEQAVKENHSHIRYLEGCWRWKAKSGTGMRYKTGLAMRNCRG